MQFLANKLPISETVQDRPKLLLTTNRKSHMHFRLVSKSMTLDDLELLKFNLNLKWTSIWIWTSSENLNSSRNCSMFTEFCATSHIWEATTAKRMKIDPYYQRQKCSPMTLVSGNIRCMRIFGGSPGHRGRGVKWQWDCWRRQFLAIWEATSSETSRDKVSSIIWRYATPCRRVSDCKMND